MEEQQDPHILKEGDKAHEERVIGGKPLDEGKGGVQTGAHAGGPLRIKLDGVVKTLSGPVTGNALHRLAGEIDGHPVNLKAGGKEVPRDDKAFDVKPDEEFTTH